MKQINLIIVLLLLANIAVGQTNVKFNLTNVPVIENARVGIRGSEKPLSWENTFFLSANDEAYIGELSFENNLIYFEYKYVIEDNNGNVSYELNGQENRLGIFTNLPELTLNDTWNIQPEYDVQNLPLIPAEKLKEDAQILGNALWELHPGVERYQDSVTYYSNLASLMDRINEPVSYSRAYKEISKFVATIKCGHTFANPFNQTGFINNIILKQKDKLPFGLEWLHRRLFITKNATDNKTFGSGTEIIAIDGILIKALADSLLALTKGDGSNDAKRFSDLNMIGYDYYEMFDVYFPLVIPPQNGFYELTVVSTDGETSVEKVATIERSKRNEILQRRYNSIPGSIEETWEYKLLDDKIAYLKLGTFAVWDFKTDWKKFLKAAFRKFDKAKAEKLIIDIRGNEGGADEVLDELQQYIQKSDCTTENFDERLRYAKVPDALQPYVFTWDKSVLDFNGQVRKNQDGSYSFVNGNEKTTTYRRSRKAFEGDIFLFTNAANSSATFYLAKHFRDCGIGKIVGQTTGGSKKGINGGNLLFIRLPNSRIEVDIPIFGQFNDNEIDQGIEPDIHIERKIEDLSSEEDEQLKRLISKLNE
jgi:hypothetical protein